LADATKDQSRRSWRALGFLVENSEFFVDIGKGRKIKKDLFGFSDLVAIPGGLKPHPLVFIQATSRNHITTRLKKIQTETTGRGQWEVPLAVLARGVLLSGNRIVIEGWDKHEGKWRVKQRWLTMEDLTGPPHNAVEIG
jgi:hypothetical protein